MMRRLWSVIALTVLAVGTLLWAPLPATAAQDYGQSQQADQGYGQSGTQADYGQTQTAGEDYDYKSNQQSSQADGQDQQYGQEDQSAQQQQQDYQAS
ncbi:MAG: hypothetical protein O2890_16105 [Cyanobacteria bacterium]|nr:hypothetical protein [Cyanobacteriota bacterium]MDA0867887.1 hypothetical protein [Cyanobacteriota bacterium]